MVINAFVFLNTTGPLDILSKILVKTRRSYVNVYTHTELYMAHWLVHMEQGNANKIIIIQISISIKHILYQIKCFMV